LQNVYIVEIEEKLFKLHQCMRINHNKILIQKFD